jgi:hypothetical protein
MMLGAKLLQIGLKILKENRIKMKEKRILKISVFLFFIFGCDSIKINESQKRFILDESGKHKYFLIEYINKNRTIIGEVPTLIIHKKNGQDIISSDEEYKGKLKLKRSDFIKIEILSIEKSIPLYGSLGKNGVLDISCYGKPNL